MHNIRLRSRPSIRLFVALTIISFMFATGVWAYGAQSHTSAGISHGCPYDYGCASGGAAGNYNRQGYDLNPYSLVQYMYVSVWDAELNTFKISNDCSNCIRVDAEWDTNPKRECEFKTFHDTVDPTYNLNGNWHWTLYATGANGC